MTETRVRSTAGWSADRRREFQITQLQSLIRAREEKAQSTERYIALFKDCFSESKLRMLQQHLCRTIESIWEMRKELGNLESPPPCSVADI